MSIKGEIEARCPGGCEPFAADVYSFIRGDKSPDLRLAVLFRECNMLLCPGCEKPFFPDAPYVYYDPSAELVAFVFPESYREKEAYWRGKMAEDFAAMREALGAAMPLDTEPDIFFGVDGLACLLESEDYRAEETEVMEFQAKELGLSLYRVSPRYARSRGVPASLPCAGPASRASVIAGLERVVAANDRLTAYADYLAVLRADRKAVLPPPSRKAS